jgi:hypothetical protein
MQTASVGRIVHVTVDPAKNNGADVAPGVIVRVWGAPYTPAHDEFGERQTINVRVLLDQQETPWLTSIPLFQERPTTAIAPDGSPARVAFWPPRS